MSSDKSELTDEQFARKLQAEWDKEVGDSGAPNQTSNAEKILHSSGPLKSTDIKAHNETGLNSENGDALKFIALSSKPQVLHEEPKSKTTLSLQSSGSADDTITANIPFDESPLSFEPAKYVTHLQDIWAAEGGNASYSLLTRCFVLINSTQSRIKIVDTLVNLLRVIIEGDPSSLLPTVRTIYYLCRISQTRILLYITRQTNPFKVRSLLNAC